MREIVQFFGIFPLIDPEFLEPGAYGRYRGDSGRGGYQRRLPSLMPLADIGDALSSASMEMYHLNLPAHSPSAKVLGSTHRDRQRGIE